jgi:hypothetical protein
LLDVFATAHWKAVFAIGRSGLAPCWVALLVMGIKSLEDFLNSFLTRLALTMMKLVGTDLKTWLGSGIPV